MKIIEKIALAIFIVITWIIALTFIFAYFNIITVSEITKAIEFMLVSETNRDVFFIIAVICVLLDIIVLSGSDDSRKSIITKGEKGTLEIMPDTIENIALIEVKNYISVCDVVTKMKMHKGSIVVNVICSVLPEVNIYDLTKILQDKIKDKIEKNVGTTVNCVNIKIKNVKKTKDTKAIKED